MPTLRTIAGQLASNPITARQIRPHHSERAKLRSATNWMIVIIGGSHAVFLFDWGARIETNITAILGMVAGFAIMVAPAATATIAATQAARDIQSGRFDLTCLSMVTDMEIIQGYIWLALYRLLKPLAIAFSIACLRFIIPALVAIEFFSDSFATAAPLWLLALAIIMVNTAGLIYNAASLGVLVAIRWRQLSTAAILAPALAFGFQVTWLILAIIGLVVAMNIAADFADRTPLWNMSVAAAFALLMLATVWGLHQSINTTIINTITKHLRR